MFQSPSARPGRSNRVGEADNDPGEQPTEGGSKCSKPDLPFGRKNMPEPLPSCTSHLSINIHASDAFNGALAVTDLEKIPWGRPGDIVEVRPAREKPTRQGGALNRGSTSLNEVPSGTGVQGEGRSRKRDRIKGNFLFKLKGNDDKQLRRLTTVSSCLAGIISEMVRI
jgi:hypothetical protein